MILYEQQKEIWGKKSGIIQHDFGSCWTWDQIIRELDNTKFLCDVLKSKGEIELGTIPMEDLGNGGYSIHAVARHKYVSDVLKEIQTIDETLLPKASMYISFNRSSKTFPEHRDPLHVWIHQYQGTTEWYVEDGEYVLKPGDILYIPPMFEHCARISEPRCSMSWNLGPHDEEQFRFEFEND